MSSIADDEILYRRVPTGRGLFAEQRDGTVRFSSQAFTDRNFRVSVDCASLCGHDPTRTKADPTDGVTSIVVRDVRAITTVIHNDDRGRPQFTYTVDVASSPLADNPAHAEIVLHPDCTKGDFRKLQQRLAQLADQRQWEIAPS